MLNVVVSIFFLCLSGNLWYFFIAFFMFDFYGNIFIRSMTELQRSVNELVKEQKRNRFSVNIALISIFSSLWVVLKLTIAQLGFAIFHLPVIHSLIIFFMLVLITWATGQYGAASTVSIIGSAIVVLVNPQVLPVLGFVPAAFAFDLILMVIHHRVNLKSINFVIVVLATIVCALIAAIVNGIIILNLPIIFTLTIWAGWNILGGLIGVTIAFPILGILDRAQVKRVRIE